VLLFMLLLVTANLMYHYYYYYCISFGILSLVLHCFVRCSINCMFHSFFVPWMDKNPESSVRGQQKRIRGRKFSIATRLGTDLEERWVDRIESNRTVVRRSDGTWMAEWDGIHWFSSVPNRYGMVWHGMAWHRVGSLVVGTAPRACRFFPSAVAVLSSTERGNKPPQQLAHYSPSSKARDRLSE